jgi:hypothetical protein
MQFLRSNLDLTAVETLLAEKINLFESPTPTSVGGLLTLNPYREQFPSYSRLLPSIYLRHEIRRHHRPEITS